MADRFDDFKDRQQLIANKQETVETVVTGAGTQGGMKTIASEQETSFFTVSAQSIKEVIHLVGKARDIAEQLTKNQTQNGSEISPSQVEKIHLAPWEYHVETNLFEFDDEFYAIYGTNVAREGRFMVPQVYAREFVHPDDVWIVEASLARGLSCTERYLSGQLEHRITRRDGIVRTIVVQSTVIRDAAGKIIKWFGANQDITEQKTMEEALRASREKLSIAVELARLGPWEFNPETKLFEFNDEFYAIYGTSVAQEGRFMTVDVYAREFMHPDDVWMLAAERDKAILSTEQHYLSRVEHRIIRRDGEVRSISVRGTIIKDAAGKILKWYGANQDITEYKALEESLRASREKLSLAVELARLGPWEFNLETNLFEFDDEFYAIYGTNAAREGRFMAPDVYIREFVHPDDAWLVETEILKGNASTESYHFCEIEHRIIRRDGEVRTIMARGHNIRDKDGNMIRCYGVNQDITELIQAEQSLRESEERLLATLNTLPDMLLRINAEGVLLDCRIPCQYSCYLLGIADRYNTISDILPVPLTQLIKEMVNLSMNTGKTGLNEYVGQINGIECFLQIRTAPVNRKEALVIIQDQTELYKAKKEFRRLDSLDLIGKMAANIGHEVRNPLTTVRGYLQYLSCKEQFKVHAEMFGLMIGELDRTNAIISEFLSLSKNKVVRLEPKNLNTIIRAIYPLLDIDALADNKSIILKLDDTIPHINLDESEIRQLIINFVRNGLEAMTDKGVLIIRTWHYDQYVLLVIKDNGSGIPDSVIEQIGTPFVTTKENGTGLGLSVCYSIAARHQANIDFTTDKNGTEFTVYFKLPEIEGEENLRPRTMPCL